MQPHVAPFVRELCHLPHCVLFLLFSGAASVNDRYVCHIPLINDNYRLLMASLFIFVGITQIQRVIARDWVMHVQVFFNSRLQLSLRTFACASLVHLCVHCCHLHPMPCII